MKGEGRIVLTWISKKSDMGLWTGFIWLRIPCSGGLFFRGNKSFFFVKGIEYLNQLSNY
jgi:hypothetical protein